MPLLAPFLFSPPPYSSLLFLFPSHFPFFFPFFFPLLLTRGTWAVVMAVNAKIDFDYLGYALKRVQGFYYMKNASLLAVKVGSSNDANDDDDDDDLDHVVIFFNVACFLSPFN